MSAKAQVSHSHVRKTSNLASRLGRPLEPRSAMIAAFADQAISSATNFAAVVVAASQLGVSEFGYFSVAYLVYTLILAATQAFISQSLVIGEEAGGAPGGRAALRTAAGIGVLSGVLLAAGTFVWIPAASWWAFAALAAGFPALLCQDVLRTLAARAKRPQLAGMGDAVWLGLFAFGAAALRWIDWVNAGSIMLCWVLAGAVSGVIPWLGFRNDLVRESGTLLRRGHLGSRFLLEHVITQGLNQLSIIALTFIAGPGATGSLRGIATLFGPIGVVISAIPVLAVPALRSMTERSRAAAFGALCVLLAITSLAVAALLMALPESLGEALLGDTWAGAKRLALPVGSQFAAIGVGTVAFTALRISMPTQTLRLRLIASVVFVAGFWTGFHVDGVRGAAWGLCFGSSFQAGLFWVFLTLSRRRPSASPSDAVPSAHD